MNTSRRNFLRTGAMALAAAAVIRKPAFASALKADNVGIQLYSIRDDMAKDPLGSLKQIAAMGYTKVEHANYVNGKFYTYAPADFKKVLNDLGLSMPAGHTVMGVEHWDENRKDFTDIWKKTVEDAALLEQKWVISPWMDENFRKTYDDLMHCLDIFNKCGELCKKSGMKFGYHNHDFEFSQKLNNEQIFDIIMRTIDPNLVALQLDIGNLYNGGAVAKDVLQKYPGRFEIIHVKDEIKSEGTGEAYESCVLGEGIVNAKEMVDLATQFGGTTCYIIEQESYQNRTPMECVKADLEIMRKWGY